MDKSKQAAALFNDYAKPYEEKYMDQTRYYDSFNEFCAWIRPMSALALELACGPGNVTKYLLEQRPDLRMLGTDLAPKMIDLARKNNPQSTFQLMDMRDIDLLSDQYDAVMCAFGLPYLNKEEAQDFIAKIAAKLNPYGVCYLSTMEGKYKNSDWQGPSSGGERQLFIHYHELAYLQSAMEENGLQIRLMNRLEYKDEAGNPVKDLILIATKN
ncbi:MAG: methyltransferase domain-containing protein [Saprospiraceae bacterium]|nr:methyltransferase domain-containing protein [Saprospiraceae bacterium]